VYIVRHRKDSGVRIRRPGGTQARWLPSPEIANLDQLAFKPAGAGAYPEGASAYGVFGMIGGV